MARQLSPAFTDHRGAITDIVQHVPFDSATIITCTPGAQRGNHYHKESVQWTYVIAGRLRAWKQDPDGPVTVEEITTGDLLESPANQRHAFEAIEASTLLILTRGPRGGQDYESDTFRVAPLWGNGA